MTDQIQQDLNAAYAAVGGDPTAAAQLFTEGYQQLKRFPIILKHSPHASSNSRILEH